MSEQTNRQKLIMKYHPAKKQVIFERFSGRDKMEIPETSGLFKYMNRSGRFILQDQSNEFLEDIAHTFAGLEEAKIDIVTTKNDYEDFVEMVKFYNSEKPDTKITINSLTELPDMDEAYKYVIEYGQETKVILTKYLEELETLDIPANYSGIKSAVEQMANVAREKLKGIDEKFNSVARGDNIRLCFSGVFSSGKSSLINAILGYPILPEAILIETAKTFSIQSPKGDGKIKVECKIEKELVIISWSNEKPEIYTELCGNGNVESLQRIVDRKNGEPVYVQLQNVLKCLNDEEEVKEVSAEIKVFFPIPLDDEKVHFTIFDTPGTDPDISSHKKILLDALSSQTHSILIFVAAANNLQGEGSRSLVEYLKQFEKSKSKTSIDIGRSLFVINWADAIDMKAREELRDKGEIKVMPKKQENQGDSGDQDDDEEQNDAIHKIDLPTRRLFFTSAKYALLAAAVRNKTASEDQIEEMKDSKANILSEKRGQYFMQDRCAQSQFGTKRIIENSQKALEEAQKNNDDMEIFHVASGLYALENEMVTYGKKFAAAVRTYAIIENVEDAFNMISSQANMLVNRNKQDRAGIESEIKDITDTLESAMTEAHRKYFPDSGDEGLFSVEDKDALHLSQIYIKNDIIDEAVTGIKKVLKNKIRFKGGQINLTKFRRNKINEVIERVINSFQYELIINFEKLLTDKRDGFIRSVKEAFYNNGGLSDDAREMIPNISVPEIKDANMYRSEFTRIMEDLIEYRFKFIFRLPMATEKELYDKLEEALMRKTEELVDYFYAEYKKEGDSISGEIHKSYTQNLNTYSTMLRGLIENRETMQEIGGKLQTVASKINECTDKLEGIIWEAKNREN